MRTSNIYFELFRIIKPQTSSSGPYIADVFLALSPVSTFVWLNGPLSEHKLFSEIPKIDLQTNMTVYAKCFCVLKEIPFWSYANVLYAGTFCFVCFCFFLLGIGLGLCFKLKRLKTSELWTSAWPTWVQVGSLIITFSPTLWRTFVVFWCQPVVDVPGRQRAQQQKKKSCVLQ